MTKAVDTRAIDVVRAERLRGGMSPLRRRLLRALQEPCSAAGLAAKLGESRQRVNYHVRELEKGGLVELVEERPRRGCVERVMRATAKAVVVDPEVIGELPTRAQDAFAADTLVAMSARTASEVARMREEADAQGKRLVTFAIEAEVGFARPAEIERFAEELAEAVAAVAARYPRRERSYRVVLGCHPKPKEKR